MNKPLKVAAWSAIISLILGMLMIPFVFLTMGNVAASVSISIISSLIGAVLGIMFLNGFLVLGRKYKNNMLVVLTWIGIILAVVGVLVGLVANVFVMTHNVSAQSENIELGSEFSDQDLSILGLTFIGLFIIIWVMITVVFGVYAILWGVALMKLQKDNVEYAKTTGILMIVAGATYIIFVGFIIRWVAWVFEIVILFKASEKLEGKRKT